MTADHQRPMPPPPAHPDLDTLADLHADALDGPTAERVAAHVTQCPQCRAVLAALDTVRADLRTLPRPPMPAGVAARLDATVADLRHADRTADRDRGPTRPHDHLPIPTTIPTTAPTTGPTAAGPPAPGDRVADPSGPGDRAPGPGDRTAVPAGPGNRAAEKAGPGDRSTGRPAGPGPTPGREPVTDLAAARARRRRGLVRGLGAVAAAVAVIGGGVSVTALVVTSVQGGDDQFTADSGTAGGSLPEQGAAATASPGVTTLNVPSYDRNTLRSSLPLIVQQSAVSIITGRDDSGSAGVMADAARRTACAGTIPGSSGELQAVQRIRYEGRMAYVFVFDADGRRTGYVVSDDCGSPSALPAPVLDTVS